MLVITFCPKSLQQRVKGTTKCVYGENREMTSNFTLDHGALNMSSATIARRGYVTTAILQRRHMRGLNEVGSKLVQWCKEMRNGVYGLGEKMGGRRVCGGRGAVVWVMVEEWER